MKGAVSKGERQRIKQRHGPTDSKGTEEQGVKIRCSIQLLTVDIAMQVEHVQCVCWSGVMVVGCYRKLCLKC